MAPRQRLSPQPSMEDISSQESSTTTSTTRPLISAADSSSSAASSSYSRSNSSESLKADSAFAALQAASEIARERHDFFNLVALLFVVGATLLNWDFALFLQGHGPATAWNGNYFWLNWATTVLYFLADLIWVYLVPICVKSSDTIIKHHLVAIAYLSGPVLWPEYRWFMGACLTVEINTWFLILRRVVYKRQERLPQALVDTISMSFYISWIIIRCVIYPAILFNFLSLAYFGIQRTKQFFHWPMIFIPVHFFLCVLNLKWSYDLFKPIVQKWMSKDKSKEVRVESGL